MLPTIKPGLVEVLPPRLIQQARTLALPDPVPRRDHPPPVPAAGSWITSPGPSLPPSPGPRLELAHPSEGWQSTAPSPPWAFPAAPDQPSGGRRPLEQPIGPGNGLQGLQGPFRQLAQSLPKPIDPGPREPAPLPGSRRTSTSLPSKRNSARSRNAAPPPFRNSLAAWSPQGWSRPGRDHIIVPGPIGALSARRQAADSTEASPHPPA